MKALKIVAYVLLSIFLIYFGSAFVKEYNKVTEQTASRGLGYDIDDIEAPVYDLNEGTTPSSGPNDSAADHPEGSVPEEQAESQTPEAASDEGAVSSTETNAVAQGVSPKSGDSASDRSNRLGFYGGGFVITLLILGLLAAFDITRYSANRTVDALYNDDGVGSEDSSLYESAEAEWARGDYLEAIRILREYLKANPKQQHAAIRIAEIYEKDLKNPLAAALEYEEILQQKLAPERWGWAAIHLANLYSGPMNKPDKAVELLRDLVAKHPETAAGEKASQRLAMIDGQA